MLVVLAFGTVAGSTCVPPRNVLLPLPASRCSAAANLCIPCCGQAAASYFTCFFACSGGCCGRCSHELQQQMLFSHLAIHATAACCAMLPEAHADNLQGLLCLRYKCAGQHVMPISLALSCEFLRCFGGASGHHELCPVPCIASLHCAEIAVCAYYTAL